MKKSKIESFYLYPDDDTGEITYLNLRFEDDTSLNINIAFDSFDEY